jgi:hypothetical protein
MQQIYAITKVICEIRQARDTLFAPIELPTSEQADCIKPAGGINIKPHRVYITVNVACSVTPRYPEITTNKLNAQVSAHIITVTGIDILRYSLHSVSASRVGRNKASLIEVTECEIHVTLRNISSEEVAFATPAPFMPRSSFKINR